MSKQNNLQGDSSTSFKMTESMSAASEFEEENRLSNLEENMEKISKLEVEFRYELQTQLKDEEQKVELAQSQVRDGIGGFHWPWGIPGNRLCWH